MVSTLASSALTIDLSTSAFERLPAEIRQIVYSFLGYPVGGYMWIDCPGPDKGCDHSSHVIFHGDAKWPMMWHALPGEFLIWRKIEQFDFSMRKSHKKGEGLFEKVGVMFKATDDRLISSTAAVDAGLLGVDRAIRDELLHLFFASIDVRFVFPLSTQSMARSYSYSDLQYGISPSIPLPPATVAYLTSITLDGTLTAVRDDTSSILFIAAHSPHLLHLTYIIHLLAVRYIFSGAQYSDGEEEVLNLVQACRVLTVNCGKIQTLRFQWKESTLGSPDMVRTLGVGGWKGVVEWAWRILAEIGEGPAA